MDVFRNRGMNVLLTLVVVIICIPSSTSRAKMILRGQRGFMSLLPRQASEHPSPLLFAQANQRIRIAVFTFNISNLGAAGYDASVSNMFMTLLDQHRVFEVMSRKQLEVSLRRAGLQQSEDLAVVQKVGTHLGLDAIVFGNISKVGSSIGFEVKLVEMARGETLLHRKEEVFGDVALRQKVDEISREMIQIARRYQPHPTVAKPKIPVFPAQPTGLQARGGSQKVALSWNANKESNLRGYKVFRSATPVGPFSKVSSVKANTFTDTGLENNRIYYYKVKAFNQEDRESPATDVLAAETAPTPFSPIMLDATPFIGGVRIRWTTNPHTGGAEGTEVAGFRIYRAGSPDGEFQLVESVPAKSDSTRKLKRKKYSYTDSRLEDGSKFSYRLTAYNTKRIESEFSSALEGKSIARPTGLQATGDMIREIHLQWHPSSFKEITGYRIYRHTAPDGTFQRIGQLQDKNKASYIDKENLGDATTYFYRITVFNKQGRESGLSDMASAVTRGKPPTPEGLTARSGMVKKVSLSWKVCPEKEVKGYYVYWNNSPTGEFKQIGKVKGRETTSFVDKGDRHRPLVDDLTCHYMITSYNKVDVKSDPSAPANATTKPRPQQPTGFSAQGGLPATVVLTWKPNPERDLRYYHLWRQQPEKKFKELKKLPPEQTNYEDQEVKHGTVYRYRLQTEDKDKLLSDFSAPVEATTKPLPEPPAGLEVKALPNGFELSWKSNSEPDIDRYKIYLKSFVAYKEIGSTERPPFTILTLDSDKEYTVAITAVDKDGLESKRSLTITVRSLEQE